MYTVTAQRIHISIQRGFIPRGSNKSIEKAVRDWLKPKYPDASIDFEYTDDDYQLKYRNFLIDGNQDHDLSERLGDIVHAAI